MTHQLRKRFWIQLLFAGASFATLLLTVVDMSWIETVFGVDPDHHSGSLEWAIVAVLLAMSLSLAALARSEWNKQLEPS